MKKICLCFGLIGILWSSSAVSATRSFMQKQCQSLMQDNQKTVVRIMYNYGSLRENHEKSTAEIDAIFQRISPAQDFGEKQGLTVFHVYDQIGVAVVYLDFDDGFRCYAPAQVDVRVGYMDTVVYFNKALKKGSCYYNVTRRHELQHLDLAYQSLSLYAMAIQARIDAVISEVGVKVSKESPESVADALAKEYQQRLLPISQLFQRTLAQEQAKLDTKENYQREQNLCR